MASEKVGGGVRLGRKIYTPVRETIDLVKHTLILSVPKFTANLYCICLSVPQIYTEADAVQICGEFWDTQYIRQGGDTETVKFI